MAANDGRSAAELGGPRASDLHINEWDVSAESASAAA